MIVHAKHQYQYQYYENLAVHHRNDVGEGGKHYFYIQPEPDSESGENECECGSEITVTQILSRERRTTGTWMRGMGLGGIEIVTDAR